MNPIESISGIEQIIDGLWAPLLYPFDPSRRIYIPFLFIGLLLALWSVRQHARRHNTSPGQQLISMLLDRSLWFNRSTLSDLQLLFLNSVLRVALVAPLLATKLTVIVLVSSQCRALFGPIDATASAHWPLGLIVALFSITLFIIEDLSRYAQHRCMHTFSFLWRFHRVHHTATHLTPLTLYRTHPVEMVISSVRSLVVIGGVTGLFVYAFPGKITAWEILGIDALGFLFNAFGANLRHSPFPLSFGRLNRWIISPVMHQLHHSSAAAHRNKNFGVCLSVWDRLGGSLYEPDLNELDVGTLKFGLSNLQPSTFNLQVTINHQATVNNKIPQ